MKISFNFILFGGYDICSTIPDKRTASSPCSGSRRSTVDEIRLRLTQDGISVGQSTVYRTVERLVADGVVSKVPSVDRSSARYCFVGRPETAAHGKLVCLQCGATRPLECHMLDELSQHLEGAHGFRIEPSRTVLYGLCAKCADGIEHSDHTCKGGCCHEH